MINDKYLIHLDDKVKGIDLPQKFTFPFFYEPHEIALIASRELQSYLIEQKDWEHNFGLREGQEGIVIGKMFGVLVVKDQQGKLGYLSAVSGKLAGINVHDRFVPPVFDMLKEEGFFKKGEKIITEINSLLEELEANPEYLDLKISFKNKQEESKEEIERIKKEIKIRKGERKRIREQIDSNWSQEKIELLLEDLRKESIREQYFLKYKIQDFKLQLDQIEQRLNEFQMKIENLKFERKERSAKLQQQLFEEYSFLNKRQTSRSLWSIFSHLPDKQPPAGAGECAAPKLLQHAFIHGYEPVALAEFWWGQSPASEVRKHGEYYPACRGKCEPILGHMLEGIETDPNPMLDNPAKELDFEIIFEDEFLLVINKPAEMLSVPGVNIHDSVYSRVKERYPEASGPMIVHRLDMSTSGLLLISKSEKIYKQLQRQFLKRTVKKRYVALLEGKPEFNEGIIELPLRVDLEDRPRQLVCYTHGKPAKTLWKVISSSENRTKVHFYPITGRTHQLRVHAAHSLGLNCPIVGDDLYGRREQRLHLHAEELTFVHPVSREEITLIAPCEF